jgi:hypothetical protein
MAKRFHDAASPVLRRDAFHSDNTHAGGPGPGVRCVYAASFVYAATTPDVHIRGMQRIPGVQHAAIGLTCGNATHSKET